MKQRTSIAMDERVRRAVERAARARGVSLSRYITEVVEAHLERTERRKKYPCDVTVRGSGLGVARDHETYAFKEHGR